MTHTENAPLPSDFLPGWGLSHPMIAYAKYASPDGVITATVYDYGVMVIKQGPFYVARVDLGNAGTNRRDNCGLMLVAMADNIIRAL